MKKILTWLLLAALCLTLCAAPALAAGSDRTLLYYSTVDGYMNEYINAALVAGEDIYVILEGMNQKLLVYRGGEGEPQEYDMQTALQDSAQDRVQADLAKLEDGEESVGRYRQVAGWTSWQGNMYAVAYDSVSHGDEGNDIEGGFLLRVVPGEDGKVTMEPADLPDLDFSNMIDDYGTWKSVRWMRRMLTVGDRLLVLTYDMNGNNVMVIFDLHTGLAEEVPLNEVNSFCAETENTLLLTRYEWAEETYLRLIRYDLTTQEEEELQAITYQNGWPNGMVCDGEGNLYFIRNGEIWKTQGADLDAAVSVNECPGDNLENAMLLPDGRMLIWGQNVLLIRSTDGNTRSETRLTVQDYAYGESLSSAIFAYGDTRSDVAVVLRRGGDYSTVLQDMMNRDAQVDIYTLPYQSSAFEALRNRGFLADLSGNAAISEMMAKAYPYIQNALTQEGKIIAVPVSLYGNTIGYNATIWQKLGGTEEELPTTWDQFFDWIQTLPDRVAGTEYAAFPTWTNRTEFQYTLLTTIIAQYQEYASADALPYNSPLLRGLLERLASLDYEALGIREEDMDEENGSYEYMESLIQTYTSVNMNNYSGGEQPLVLRLTEDADPILPVNLSVAFVNPYSAHPQEAMEFLAAAMDCLSSSIRYSVDTRKTDPIRYPDYEEYKQNMQQWLDQAKEQLAKAAEEDKETWQANVDEIEENVKNIDETYWMISPASIEAFLKRVNYLRPASYDLASSMISDSGNNYYEMVWGYAQGEVTAEELLSGIDKKVQMMRLEGN